MFHTSDRRASRLIVECFFLVTPILILAGPAAAAGTGGADISIERTIVQPARQDSSTGGANFTLTITLVNRGNASGAVRLTATDSGGTFLDEPITVDANASWTATVTWVVNGTGKHRATIALSGENATAPLSADVACELGYVPLKNPSPWYTIPCAFLFIIVPSVGIWLLIRRMRGGEWLDKKDGKPGNRGAGEPEDGPGKRGAG